MSMDVGTLPHAALSFANSGEDMALRKLLKHRIARRQGGMYLDIGCSAPCCSSNSYLFYCLGWRGVCVDPNPEAAPHWKESRPEDVFISAAVGKREGSTRLFFHKTNLGMHVIGDAPPSDDYAGETVVPVRRLDSILAEHAKGRDIQFLSLDVEGAELGVLKSNAWDTWRPEYILIEAKDFDMLAPRKSETINFLLDLGYTLDSKVSENIILRR